MGNRDINDSSLERPEVLKGVKVVVVGPAKCGKTALVQRFVNDTFFDTYTPTGFEKYSTKYKVGEFAVEFSIWDTSGSGAYDSIRPLAYQDANVFLLCFNVGDPEDLKLAINKWYPEIRSHSPNTPVVLCGCRADVRNGSIPNDTDIGSFMKHTLEPYISTEQALLVAKHISAASYVETTSAYGAVTEAFEVAAEAALGLLNKKTTSKKKLFGGSQSPIPMKTNSTHQKTNIKSELKGRAKNCSIM